LKPEGWALAAVLACGPDAVLSHFGAARHRRLVQSWRARIDVTVPSRSGRSQAGIRLHRVGMLDPLDWEVHEGIPTTTVARTLLDLAAVVDASQLTRAIEAAERNRTFDLTAVRNVMDRHPRRHGTRALREVLSYGVIEPASRSVLESIFHDLVGRAGLPRAVSNTLVEGFEVDAYWPDLNLIVEIDSYDYHRSPAAFERDRRRDLQLTLAGHTVLRFTDRQLTQEPESVVAALAQAQAQAASARR
jgi:hypothetical protein